MEPFQSYPPHIGHYTEYIWIPPAIKFFLPLFLTALCAGAREASCDDPHIYSVTKETIFYQPAVPVKIISLFSFAFQMIIKLKMAEQFC